MKTVTMLKRDIQDKTRMVYGLMYILKEDVDNLRLVANELDLFRMHLYIKSINEMLDKLVTAIAEIEYAIYQINLREKNT